MDALSVNTRRVAEVLRANGPRTRAELIALAGLSRPTVSTSLSELAALDVLTEELGSVTGPAGGRPASVVRLSRAAGLAIGVDVGRRHIRVAVADLGHAVVRDEEIRLPFETDDYPTEVLRRAVDLVDSALRAVGSTRDDVIGVGFGVPAPITRSGAIGAPALLPGWAELVPAAELSDRLDLPVLADNDANVGALAEYVWGAGRGCADLVYVKMATGIGAGIVLDGRLYRGASGTAGELGHITLNARGPVCRCGNRGCLELTAGGRAVLEYARASYPNIEDLVELVDLALDGDAGCRRLLVDAGIQLGVALGGLVNLVNPDRIILGGELGRAAELLLEPMRRGLGDSAMPAAAQAAQLVPAQLGDRASSLGALALALTTPSLP